MVAAVVVSLLLLSSCKKEKEPELVNEKPNIPVVPADGGLYVSAAGNPTGSSSTTTIGIAGGTAVSTDGRLTLSIPAGALSGDTQIGIQPISNLAPLGIQSSAYRLTPEGVTFNSPVELTFSYANLELEGTPADFLWVTTQKADGSWEAARKSVVNTSNQTVRVEVSHFSDWALGKFIDLGLAPGTATLAKNQILRLFAVGFKQVQDDEDDFVPLYPINHDDGELVPLVPVMPDETQMTGFQITGWSLNGNMAPVSGDAGHLVPEDFTAVYQAPAEVPSPNPVAVSLHLKANNYLGGISNYILTSNITILDNDLYLHLNAPGDDYTYYQWGINGSIPPSTGEICMINCGFSEGQLEIAGGVTSSQGAYSHSFVMEVGGLQPGTYVLMGSNCNGDEGVSYSADPMSGFAYSLNLVRRNMNNQVCEDEYTCADFITKITAYNDETKIVEGNFSGNLYYDPPDAWDNCTSSEEIQVSGSFRLKVLF